MKYFLCLLLLLPAAFTVSGQSYADSISAYRVQYIADLLSEPRHPVSQSQAKLISFFYADPGYSVWADVVLSPGSKPFLIPTHSGKQKPFKEYAVITFQLHDTTYSLHAYTSVSLINDTAHNDELFIPFTDLTNYDATYGGGRYIDLSLKDIINGRVRLDFNKCYNPYCAYADGFSCPIPPSENDLQTYIRAGERSFPR